MIVWVVGVPRSGTSMLMRMLEAGGLPAHQGDVRRLAPNPHGYYEHPDVMAEPAAFLPSLAGPCAVKVMAQRIAEALAAARPDRAVVTARRPAPQAASWSAAYDRAAPDPADLYEALAALDAAGVPSLTVDYDTAVLFPRATAARVAAFTGLDAVAMAAVPDPALRHYGG